MRTAAIGGRPCSGVAQGPRRRRRWPRCTTRSGRSCRPGWPGMVGNRRPQPVLQGDRRRRRVDAHRGQRRQVVPLDGRRLTMPVRHRRHDRPVGDRARARPGASTRSTSNRPASMTTVSPVASRGQGEVVQAGDVEQRQAHQEARAAALPEARPRRAIASLSRWYSITDEQVAVRVHRTFRMAGGAAGVHDHGRVVLVRRRHRAGASVGGAHEIGERRRRCRSSARPVRRPRAAIGARLVVDDNDARPCCGPSAYCGLACATTMR